MASVEIFKELQSDRENSHCFDCGRSGAQWASINNSIFMCFDFLKIVTAIISSDRVTSKKDENNVFLL